MHCSLLYLIYAFISSLENTSMLDCGTVVDDSLTSPGYPDNYPRNMDCNYTAPIPRGMVMEIKFHNFDVEHHSKCK